MAHSSRNANTFRNKIRSPFQDNKGNNNPWSSLVTDSQCSIQVERVEAFVMQAWEKHQNNRQAHRPSAVKHPVKERDFVTYNYNYEDLSSHDEGDTLSSILVRAMDRKDRHKQLEEQRKIRQLEEAKRKSEQEQLLIVEQRRRQSEALRQMQDRHRLRVLREEQRRRKEAQEHRQRELADAHYRKILLRQYFRKLEHAVTRSRDKHQRAVDHHRRKLLTVGLSKITMNAHDEIRWRVHLATSFYNTALLNKCFTQWKEYLISRKASMAVAVEHHRINVHKSHLATWRVAAMDSLLERRTKIQQADQFYNRMLLQLAMRKWKGFINYRKNRIFTDVVGTHLRDLVKKLLPDFSPTSTDESDVSEDEWEREAREEDKRWEDRAAVYCVSAL